MTKSLRAAIVVLGVFALSCGGSGDPELLCEGAAEVTLTGGAQAVFDAKCKVCHIANYTYGDYTTAAETFENTTNVVSFLGGSTGTLRVVQPNNLANSSLWLKVLGGDAANRKGPKGEHTLGKMPNDGTELTPAQKQLLKDWICTGAKQ